MQRSTYITATMHETSWEEVSISWYSQESWKHEAFLTWLELMMM